VPNARIGHVLGTCSKSSRMFVEWHKHKGMIRFYRKFFKHQYPGVLMWLVAGGVWLRYSVVVGHQIARRIVRKLKDAKGNGCG